MIDRFHLFVILRAQVSDRAVRRRYLAAEAIMTALAEPAGIEPALAGITGLGAMADAQLCAANPDRRGEVAEEFLLTEGVPEAAAAAVRQCYRELDVARLSDLAALLVATEGILDLLYEELEHVSLDEVRASSPGTMRAAEALARLELDPLDSVAAAIDAMRAIREDLEL